MFRKPHDAKVVTQIKSSDKRKLSDDLQKAFNIDKDAVRDLEITAWAKAKSRKGDNLLLYFGPKANKLSKPDPLFFKIDAKDFGSTFPTVYTCDRIPGLLPFVATHSGVIPRLVDGSPLFLAGTSQRSLELLPKGLAKGSLVAVVAFEDISTVVAIGTLVDSREKLLANYESGQGASVDVVHARGDYLWDSGSGVQAKPLSSSLKGNNSVSPTGPEPAIQTSADDSGEKRTKKPQEPLQESGDVASLLDDLLMSDDDDSIKTEELSNSEADVSSNLAKTAPLQQSTSDVPKPPSMGPELTKEAIDSMLYIALCKGISESISKHPEVLPLPVDQAYQRYVLPYRPLSAQGKEYLKKSSFKDLTAFFTDAASHGILSLAKTKSILQVTNVFPSHHDVENAPKYRPFFKGAVGQNTKPPRVELEHYYLAQKETVRDWLQAAAPSLLSKRIARADLLSVIPQYFKSHDLYAPQNSRLVRLDLVLSKLLNEPQQKYLDRALVVQDILKHFAEFYEITRLDGTQISGAGPPPQIILHAEKIRNHDSTVITNAELYLGGSFEALADDLRRLCATSCTVGPSKRGSKNAVHVHAPLAQRIHNYLVDKGVPKQLIDGSTIKKMSLQV